MRRVSFQNPTDYTHVDLNRHRHKNSFCRIPRAVEDHEYELRDEVQQAAFDDDSYRVPRQTNTALEGLLAVFHA